MKLLCLGMLPLLLISCATPTRQTDTLVKNRGNLPLEASISSVPFIKQKKNHCGPASMAMVMRHLGNKTKLKDLTTKMYTSGAEGTFQSEMLSVARRHGLLALPITDLTAALTEINNGNPIIVFQNLGFSLYPKWHYAVATGYNLEGPDIILHTGEDKFKKWDMRLFEHTWKLAGKWALLVLRPDQLSATASDLSHVAAAAFLESINRPHEAKTSYETILSRWPRSLGALLGLGNVHYSQKNYSESIRYLKLAHKFHPQEKMVQHNLAVALKAENKSSDQ